VESLVGEILHYEVRPHGQTSDLEFWLGVSGNSEGRCCLEFLKLKVLDARIS
jgi:hypothetical protein